MSQEIWKDVMGYEDYMVSDKGRMISKAKEWISGNSRRCKKPETYMLPQKVGGYLKVVLMDNGKRYMPGIHRLVATAFIENPENKTQVNHKDGNKHNNRADNLEWATPSENIIHAFKNGLSRSQAGSFDHHSSRIILNTSTGIFYGSLTEAAYCIGMKKVTLCASLKGRMNNKTDFIYA